MVKFGLSNSILSKTKSFKGTHCYSVKYILIKKSNKQTIYSIK